MMKIVFERLAIEVDKLYNYQLEDEKEIAEHCDFISKFIESCGWEVNDFIGQMINDGLTIH